MGMLTEKDKKGIVIGAACGAIAAAGFYLGWHYGVWTATTVVANKLLGLANAATKVGDFPAKIVFNEKTGEALYFIVKAKPNEAFKNMVRVF